MRQYEAVIEVMRRTGGYATLGSLYGEALKVRGCNWGTKTPFASIRRIVQDPRFFFRIRPGLWALNEKRADVERLFGISRGGAAERAFDHSYYQGLLVEVGNMRGLRTYVPPQDGNKRFLGKRLAEVRTEGRLPEFTYERVVRKAQTIDVVWLNGRGFPDSVFEVEHSTEMWGALVKFCELQDFRTGLRLVGPAERGREAEEKTQAAAFEAIRGRVEFWDYERVSALHARVAEERARGGGVVVQGP